MVAGGVQCEAGEAAGTAQQLPHQLLLHQVVHAHMVLTRDEEQWLQGETGWARLAVTQVQRI
jgi:hypothetical protein